MEKKSESYLDFSKNHLNSSLKSQDSSIGTPNTVPTSLKTTPKEYIFQKINKIKNPKFITSSPNNFDIEAKNIIQILSHFKNMSAKGVSKPDLKEDPRNKNFPNHY